jgi:hypothetical protein
MNGGKAIGPSIATTRSLAVDEGIYMLLWFSRCIVQHVLGDSRCSGEIEVA